jgi:hypothetical protein
MSKMNALCYAIQEDLEEGELSFSEIAIKHGVPMEWVDDVYTSYVVMGAV